MKNSKMPAMPISGGEREYARDIGEAPIGSGLTKREYFAGIAMQGFLASISGMEAAGYKVTDEEIANLSVSQADALLAELEK